MVQYRQKNPPFTCKWCINPTKGSDSLPFREETIVDATISGFCYRPFTRLLNAKEHALRKGTGNQYTIATNHISIA